MSSQNWIAIANVSGSKNENASESESVAHTMTVQDVLTLARTTQFDAFAQNPTGLAL